MLFCDFIYTATLLGSVWPSYSCRFIYYTGTTETLGEVHVIPQEWLVPILSSLGLLLAIFCLGCITRQRRGKYSMSKKTGCRLFVR